MIFQAQLKRAMLLFHQMLARTLLPVTDERGTLLCFLFHSLFESGEELRSGELDPQQGITVEMFRAFLGHFHEQGYRFVSPRQILEGLQPGGRHILLTFDDGYFNNVRALPMMEEFNAPAVFFVSSDHVREGKAFWWDAAFRQGRKHRKTEKEIRLTVAGYKRLKTEEVESDLKKNLEKTRYARSAIWTDHSLRASCANSRDTALFRWAITRKITRFFPIIA